MNDTNMVVVNSVEVKRGETDSPEIGTIYYTPHIGAIELHYPWLWDEDELDKTHLDRGIVFLNKEDATSMAKAMLNFSKT